MSVRSKRWRDFQANASSTQMIVFAVGLGALTVEEIPGLDGSGHKDARRAIARWADETKDGWWRVDEALAAAGFGPPPLDPGRWEPAASCATDCDEYVLPYTEDTALALFTERDVWKIKKAGEGDSEGVMVSVDDLERAAAIIRWHEEQDAPK